MYKNTLFSIVFYYFYLNIGFGYTLSIFFLNFFDKIYQADFCQIVRFRKKFSIKNIIRIIVDFFWKRIKSWFKRINEKFLLLIDAIYKIFKTLKICKNKFKSIRKFKRNFRLLKIIFGVFWDTFRIFCSFWNELLFLNNVINWVIQWKNLLQLLSKESVLIRGSVYFLYLILLTILGIIIGFLLGLYTHNREDEINAFILLILLKILYDTGFNSVLSEYLYHLSLEKDTVESFCKFSLKTISQIDPRPSKLTLKVPQKFPLPFLILEDPVILIETEFLWNQLTNCQLELFEFYRDVNKKV